MSKGESTLGITVNTDGLEEAGSKLKDLSGDLKGIQQQTAEAGRKCQQLGDDTAKALGMAGKAAEALAQGEADLADQQAKLEDGIKGLKGAIESLPEQLEICSDEHNRRMKEAKEAAEKLKNEMGGLKGAAEALSSVYDKVSSFRDSLVNAYKGLDDARQKLKFFGESAAETENTILQLSEAATEWGQSQQDLTTSATSLIKEGLASSDLEGIVKASVASRNDLSAATQTFISASKGEASALKTLREDYKLNIDKLKDYGFELDKAGKISVKTAEEQRTLGSALSEIAKNQYNDAITKQQETLTGAMQSMENAIQKAKQTFGEALAPAVADTAKAISGLVDSFNSLDPATQRTIAKMGALLGSITLAVAGIGKLIGIALSVKTAYSGLISSITNLTKSLSNTTTAGTQTVSLVKGMGDAAKTTAGSTSALSTAVTSLLNPLNLLVVACGAVAYALIDVYNNEQKIASARLDAESKTQVEYYQDVRKINEELRKQGLTWQDIGDRAKEARIVEILAKSKDGAILLNKALNDTSKKLQETEAGIKRIDKEIANKQSAQKWLERIGTALDYSGIDLGSSLIGKGLNYLSGQVGNTSELEKKKAEEQAKADQLKNEKDLLARGVKANRAEQARQQRIAKFEAERKQQEEARQKAEEDRANVLKEKLNDILESARGLKPTDEGIERTNELLQTWVKIKDANTALITGNKELNKLWDRGYKSLDDQLTKLVEAWEAIEAKKRAEKVFGELIQQENDLQNKSLLDQKAGLDNIIAAYNDILQHDKIITSNAEYRKQAEEAVKNLTSERLEIEEKIANLQKTAQQELRQAQEEGLKIETDLVKMQKEQADAKGNKAESQRLEKRLKELEARQKDIDARKDMEAYQSQRQEIIDKYAPKLKASEGTSAYGTYLSARQRELDNLEKNRSLQKQQAEWKIEQEELQKQKEAQEALSQGKQQETAQTVKASDSLDKLSRSADKASASLDRKAQENITEYGGIKAKVQSGKPVEILETPDTYNPQKWEWTPSYEMIKVMDQIKGINLPSVGNPIPREMVNSKQSQYNTYTNNVTVNGIPAANQTVDTRQIALHAANMAETELSRKLSANGINNYC